MADPKKSFSAEDLDAAMRQIEKSISETAVVVEKSVDKRAMGGAVESQVGEISGAGDDRTGLPKVGDGTREVSKLQGNFAERYPMDSPKAEGDALAAAKADSAKPVERDKEPVNKSTEAPAEPGETEKAVDKEKKDEESSKPPFLKSADSDDEGEDGKDDGKVEKSIRLIKSAAKHLSKAYEGGSDGELTTAGNRLVAAKQNLLKSIASGENVPAELVKSLDNASACYGEALAAFDNDDINAHCKAVEDSQSYMLKALNAYEVKTPVVKSISSVKFTHKDGRVYAEMTEEQYGQVEKALTAKGLYKSFLSSMPRAEQKTIDATPILKSLVDGLKTSFDSLQDNLQSKESGDREFKKSVVGALEVFAKSNKQLLADVEALKSTPNVRKSVVTMVPSPLGAENKPAISKGLVTEILEKGMQKKICGMKELLAWDVDKDLTPEIPQKYVDLCERIQRS
jgi:hypothetical protein